MSVKGGLAKDQMMTREKDPTKLMPVLRMFQRTRVVCLASRFRMKRHVGSCDMPRLVIALEPTFWADFTLVSRRVALNSGDRFTGADFINSYFTLSVQTSVRGRLWPVAIFSYLLTPSCLSHLPVHYFSEPGPFQQLPISMLHLSPLAASSDLFHSDSIGH